MLRLAVAVVIITTALLVGFHTLNLLLIIKFINTKEIEFDCI